jgi:hypothetical protein
MEVGGGGGGGDGSKASMRGCYAMAVSFSFSLI